MRIFTQSLMAAVASAVSVKFYSSNAMYGYIEDPQNPYTVFTNTIFGLCIGKAENLLEATDKNKECTRDNLMQALYLNGWSQSDMIKILNWFISADYSHSKFTNDQMDYKIDWYVMFQKLQYMVEHEED